MIETREAALQVAELMEIITRVCRLEEDGIGILDLIPKGRAWRLIFVKYKITCEIQIDFHKNEVRWKTGDEVFIVYSLEECDEAMLSLFRKIGISINTKKLKEVRGSLYSIS